MQNFLALKRWKCIPIFPKVHQARGYCRFSSQFLCRPFFQSSFQINSVPILLSKAMCRGEGRRRGKRKGINQWSDHFQGTPFGAEKYKISCLDKRYDLHLLNTQLQLKTLLSCSYVVTNSAEHQHFTMAGRGDAFLCPPFP